MTVESFPSPEQQPATPVERERMHERLAEAWQHYLPTSEERHEEACWYHRQGRAIGVERFGGTERSITLIASINIDPKTGEPVSGHDYNPEARSMRDIEDAFARYRVNVPLERQVVVYEGKERMHGTRDEAISEDTESGLLQWLAHEHGVRAVSGEPSDPELAEGLERRGVSRLHVAALYCVWNKKTAQAALDDTMAGQLWGEFHHAAAELGVEGFRRYTDEEKSRIRAEGREEEVFQTFREPVEGLIAHINELVRQQTGRGLITVDGDRLRVNLEGRNMDELMQEQVGLYNPVFDAPLQLVARAVNEQRDAHLAELLVREYEAGNAPFSAYGFSHVISIKPVLDSYFRSR